MNPVFSYIYQHPLFTEEDLKKLSESHFCVEFKKGDFLLKEGETSDEYYLLEEGLVRAFVHDYDNNEITTEFFTSNEIVIIPSSLFQKIPSKEYLQAVTDCVLWKIKYDVFQELFHSIEAFREEAAGKKINKNKMSIAEHGFMSLCWDPDGNMFGFTR